MDISPASAGWRYSSLRVLNLNRDDEATWRTGDSEWIVLPLAGRCASPVATHRSPSKVASSVFERVSDFAYVPRDATVTIASAVGGRFALLGARCEHTLPARYGSADDVAVELRGAGSASRQCNNFASPDGFETDRLVAGRGTRSRRQLGLVPAAQARPGATGRGGPRRDLLLRGSRRRWRGAARSRRLPTRLQLRLPIGRSTCSPRCRRVTRF